MQCTVYSYTTLCSAVYSIGCPFMDCSNCPYLSTSLCIVLCTALHCTALHCTALHCTALHCTALQHNMVEHCGYGGFSPNGGSCKIQSNSSVATNGVDTLPQYSTTLYLLPPLHCTEVRPPMGLILFTMQHFLGLLPS